MVKQKLIVVYGLPRTGTTFLFDRFIANGAYGTRAKEVSDLSRQYVTEEPVAISRVAFSRQCPGYRSNRYVKKLWRVLDRFFLNNQTDLPIITKAPTYSFVGDLMHEYFIEHDIDAIWINTRRNMLDIIASSDNQGELFHSLFHNAKEYTDEAYKQLYPAMFFNAPCPVVTTSPEFRAVLMLKNMQSHEAIVTEAVNPFVFNYDVVPADIDAQIETLTGINPGISEHWCHGSGRKHETKLDLLEVINLLEVIQ